MYRQQDPPMFPMISAKLRTCSCYRAEPRVPSSCGRASAWRIDQYEPAICASRVCKQCLFRDMLTHCMTSGLAGVPLGRHVQISGLTAVCDGTESLRSATIYGYLTSLARSAVESASIKTLDMRTLHLARWGSLKLGPHPLTLSILPKIDNTAPVPIDVLLLCAETSLTGVH